ncbi:MAG: DUF4143 domain-containing protein [Betaproteobacteria bacterium]|nr:DUF4143 domain-containing protein [Betaproteobacteria bacterium]
MHRLSAAGLEPALVPGGAGLGDLPGIGRDESEDRRAGDAGGHPGGRCGSRGAAPRQAAVLGPDGDLLPVASGAADHHFRDWHADVLEQGLRADIRPDAVAQPHRGGHAVCDPHHAGGVGRVRPFSGGGRREIIAQPKLYAFDTGFVCHARGWDRLRLEDLGTLWEHMVLETLLPHPPEKSCSGAINPNAKSILSFPVRAARWMPSSASGALPHSILKTSAPSEPFTQAAGMSYAVRTCQNHSNAVWVICSSNLWTQ